MIARFPTLAVAAGLALAACAEPTMVYTTDYRAIYSPSHIQLAASAGDTLAVIKGNPFAADRNNEGILGTMHGQNFGPPLRYSQTPRADDRYGYKVVIAFGLPPVGYADLCRNPDQPTRPAPAGRTAITAFFCIGDIVLSEDYGLTAAVDGPADPRFRRLMSDVLVNLMPPKDPTRDGNDCRVPNC